ATLTVPGLQAPVEIIRDRWGINHIYAETEYDLFFAQGYAAARDRLFQFEVWRAQATGTVAEMLGPDELWRDIGFRLFRYRGDMTAEMNHYHDRGSTIIPAYVDGVNAYIAETEADPSLLPIEFELLGIRPKRWTPEVVISRHQGLLGNIGSELGYGRAVAAVGAEAVKRAANFHPGDPDITLDPAIDGALLSQDILGLYNAFRGRVRFRRDHLAPEHRGDSEALGRLEAAATGVRGATARPGPATEATRAVAGRPADALGLPGALTWPDAPSWPGDTNRDAFDWPGPATWPDLESLGSNNWVVSGRLSESGFPLMANDPHRAQSAPSLRYWVHLVGPGWNVIGGGEPEIPGVSIGHNGYGAWGLTVFRTDGEDLYVYETDPDDPNRYRYRDGWEEMTVITEEIPVKGQAPHTAEFKYTRHGPVVFEDPGNHVAYAVRAAWLEPGGAPYLASLRMNQAKTWEEFVEACNYSNIPGENMVWADREGNIGWQAVGIAPVRRNWSGLVPVPGDGRYEWDGYLPIRAKPSVHNPPEGFFATANNHLTPADYPHMDAIGYEWSDPYRWARAVEVLGSGRLHSMADMMALQTDYLSIPARTLVPMLRHVHPAGDDVERARQLLLDWDFVLTPESVAAAIYVAFEGRLRGNVNGLFIPAAERRHLRGMALTKVIGHLTAPGGEFGDDPIAGRDAVLLRSLEEAVAALREKLGGDMDRWRYGQPDYKHATIFHPLSQAAPAEIAARLTVGPHPRGGYSFTLNNTGGGDNQTSGASFRIILDTGDWDRTVGSNTPGQSGDPASPFYDNLFELWANDRFFPVFYSRDRVESVEAERWVLTPR
ncbi:MAG: penicillin acylase family protein, partial [Gemmatimonadetes bacterium]|nr:penicillin acylase family protein [Gemmatimonadota bacterium]MYI45451.1 penicillin acylase family protein [Gemmatimonadota bacterium]